MLPIQVSKLVSMIKEESKSRTGSETKKQLMDKIASLSQSELARAKEALAMIWKGLAGRLDPPASKPVSDLPANFALFSNWHRVKLAIFKSISTGTFIDVQFYAYNAVCNNLPRDPKPLFTSSIVIEEWGSAISTRKP